ncbi:MAG: UDP-N-acetylmuramoyl-tripeptide--D-alanyl-D-alanine ligase [Halieaceae bacterium]|jgi:UDP-N-acetylmuramoyl-tripeptide--D-alanyl-D-alanine ligase|nr:UDP-N-acetylmuramoyl-tripeptide--D-alanyl-D-alanine ligase [Halieaceae bacterium]
MMAALDLAKLAAGVGAAYEGRPLLIHGAAIDSRRVEVGDLFVAVTGERVDGHDYVSDAAERGAVAALTQRAVEASIPCIVVEDSLAALTEIARRNRDAFGGCVLAITGSCGKTSVKNICRAIFEEAAPTVATRGNYNNEIGVPLTLTRLADDVQFAVVEMGATGRGDVARLCELARPRVSAVLNAMEAHLDGFGSVDDVARIKAEIYDGLDGDAVAVLGLDSTYMELWRERIAVTGARIVTWSLLAGADVHASAIDDLGAEGSAFELHVGDATRSVKLPLPGRHNVSNALVAAALAYAAGLEIDAIAAGIARAEGEAGRLQHRRLADGTVLIDDSYNANPGSVRAAIDFLADREGRRCLILGEMLELGSDAAALHAQMGRRAREAGIDTFVGVGAALAPAVEAFGDGAELFSGREDLAPHLSELLLRSDRILVKGSRGAAMETVIADLCAAAEGDRSC